MWSLIWLRTRSTMPISIGRWPWRCGRPDPDNRARWSMGRMSWRIIEGERDTIVFFHRKEFAGMKIKTSTIIWLSLVFIWCIFMGVTAISIGLGALFTPMNLIAKPFVCPNGQMTYDQ